MLMVKKLLEPFMKKNCKNEEEFRIEKAIKKKGNNVYVKWLSKMNI